MTELHRLLFFSSLVGFLFSTALNTVSDLSCILVSSTSICLLLFLPDNETQRFTGTCTGTSLIADLLTLPCEQVRGSCIRSDFCLHHNGSEPRIET